MRRNMEKFRPFVVINYASQEEILQIKRSLAKFFVDNDDSAIQTIFKIFDKEQKGLILTKDLREILNNTFKYFNPIQDVDIQLQKAESDFNGNLSQDQLLQVLNQCRGQQQRSKWTIITLYDKIGDAKFSEWIDALQRELKSNSHINIYFKNVNWKGWKTNFCSFVKESLGGPQYLRKPLFLTHRNKNIPENAFENFIEICEKAALQVNINPENCKQMIENLKQFKSQISIQPITEVEMLNLKQALSLFFNQQNDQAIEVIFKTFDRQKVNIIDKQDLSEILISLFSIFITKEEIEIMLQEADEQNTGKIYKEDLLKVLRKYRQIGGESSWAKLAICEQFESQRISMWIDKFQELIQQEISLYAYFKEKDIKHIIEGKIQMMNYKMDGPNQWTGKNLYEIHKNLNITPQAFDTLANLAEEAAIAVRFPKLSAKNVKTNIQSFKNQIVVKQFSSQQIEELQAALTQFFVQKDDSAISTIFMLFDREHTGQINKSIMSEVMITAYSIFISEEEIDEMINQADVNQTDIIGIEELKAALLKSRNSGTDQGWGKLALFSKIGSLTIKKWVQKFYLTIEQDEILKPYFVKSDIKRVAEKQIAFMTQSFGGPVKYKGRGLYQIHRNLNITEEIFDYYCELAYETAVETGIPEEQAEIMKKNIESFKKQIIVKSINEEEIMLLKQSIKSFFVEKDDSAAETIFQIFDRSNLGYFNKFQLQEVLVGAFSLFFTYKEIDQMLQEASSSNSGLINQQELLEVLKKHRSNQGFQGWAKLAFYDQIGSENLEKFLSQFYGLIQGDIILKPYFMQKNLNKIVEKQVQFMSSSFGGPIPWTGKSLYEIHKNIKVTPEAFDRYLELAETSAIRVNIPRQVAQKLKENIQSFRKQIIVEPINQQNIEKLKSAMIRFLIKKEDSAFSEIFKLLNRSNEENINRTFIREIMISAFGLFVTKEEIDHMLNEADQNKNGTIQRDELYEALLKARQSEGASGWAKFKIFDSMGNQGITKWITEFYNRCAKNPILAPYFKQYSLKKVMEGQIQFITHSMGGPTKWSGRSLEEIHRNLGVTDHAFNIFCDIAYQTAVSIGFSKELAEILKVNFECFREQVVI